MIGYKADKWALEGWFVAATKLVGVVENTNGNPLIFLRQQPTDYKLIRRNSGEFFISLAILVIRPIRLIRREKRSSPSSANFLKYRS